MVELLRQRRFMKTWRYYSCRSMTLLSLMMVMMWQVERSVGETPYHYISQVAKTTPQTLSPKPLFSPHDLRREGNGRKDVSLQADNGRAHEYGAKLPGQTGGISGQHLVFTDPSSSVAGGEQAFWYPVYSEIQYPGWISLSETPYVLSYGALPEGYEPIVPLRGDPTGYSFSYQADDHSRHETSDGRGNFYSSFSSIPSAGTIGQRPLDNLPTFDVLSTGQPPVVNIPARNPTVYSTVAPPRFPTQQPSTSKPIFTPSQKPPDPYHNDFTNGFYFESKKLFTTRTPQTPLTAGSHALSTNIQYDNLSRESSSKPTLVPSGSRSVTIAPVVPTSSPQVSTDRSYQTLSRSLSLAFASKRLSTIAAPLASSSSTEKPISSQNFRRLSEGRAPFEVETQRSASRRSTTENVAYSTLRRSTTPFPPSSSKKPSVIQKIPRKLKPKNVTTDFNDPAQRPSYIDDLTSLAYSADKTSSMNSTFIQFKPRNDKNRPDASEKTAAHEKLSFGTDYLKNSSRTNDIITKDGYIVGNKTYLGGLGLTSNIHY